jgi:hypothetical protein
MKMTISDNEFAWHTACHEAGHTVVLALLGILRNDLVVSVIPISKYELGSVSISKREGFHDSGKKWDARYVRKLIIARFAGPAVSIKLNPHIDLLDPLDYCELDMQNAAMLKASLYPNNSVVSDPEYVRLYAQERTWKKAVALVGANWKSITAIAKELIKRGTMKGVEVKMALGMGR